jgi:hypothetical protein
VKAAIVFVFAAALLYLVLSGKLAALVAVLRA